MRAVCCGSYWSYIRVFRQRFRENMKENGQQEDQLSIESIVVDQLSLTESQKEEANSFTISRPVYNRENFIHRYDHETNSDRNLKDKLKRFQPEVSCRRVTDLLLSFVPLFIWLPKYRIRNLPSDIAAGLTVGVMNIPQGLAYALLASVPPIIGLYTSFIPVLIYFVLGTSRHIAIGTFAIVSTMVGEVCEDKISKFNIVPSDVSNTSSGSNPWSPEDELKIKITVALTLLVGIIQTAMGLVHLGFVTTYLSRPLVSGFTTGAAFIVFTSQVKYFFGISPPRYSGPLALPKTYHYLFKHIADTNVAALCTGLICVFILFAIDYLNKKYKSRLPVPIPSQLIVIIIGSAVSYTARLNPRFDVSIIGSIPKGLPKFSVPEQQFLSELILDAFLIALVAATTNLSLVKLFAQRNEYKTDSNQELLAYGCMNLISSFFSCFVSSGSLSRSVVQESMGKTQITSFVSSVAILLVLLFIAPLFEPLPKPVLAAIVVVSLRRLFEQFGQLRNIWKISQVDALIWFISCFAVVFLGIVLGLIAGFAVTLFSIIYRASKANVTTLGHLNETELYKDPQLCLNAKSVPGIEIVQFEGPLIFVNAEDLLDNILTIVQENCHERKQVDHEDVAIVEKTWALPGNVVETIVPHGDKRIALKMVRNTNPMSDMVSFNNLGSDDFTEQVTGNETEFSGESADCPSPPSVATPVPDEKIHSLIIDFFAVTMIDFVGIQCLRQIIEKSEEMGVHILLAGCSYYTQRHMSRDDFLAKYIERNSFLSVHDAVLYLRATKARVVPVRKTPQPNSSATSEEGGIV